MTITLPKARAEVLDKSNEPLSPAFRKLLEDWVREHNANGLSLAQALLDIDAAEAAAVDAQADATQALADAAAAQAGADAALADLLARGTYLESFTGAIGSWSNGVCKSVASLALPPGTWDVQGQLTFSAAAITGTLSQANLNLAAGDNGGPGDRGRVEFPTVPTSGAPISLVTATVQFAGGATVHLNGQMNFTAGTPSALAFLRARMVLPP